MANPDFFAQARGDAARKGFEAQTEEELPENLEELSFDETQQLPEATVLSPAQTPLPKYYRTPDDTYPPATAQIGERPDTLVNPPMADIAQSPRAAAGGPGETPGDMEVAAADAVTKAQQLEQAVLDAVGFTDIDRVKQLIMQAEGGIIGIPEDQLQLLREYVSLYDKGLQYQMATEEAGRAME